jgi:integrase/recombinase XerD
VPAACGEDPIEKYFADAAARHLAQATIRKRRELSEGKLLSFCCDQSFHLLRQLDVDALRSFRNGWRYSASSATKRHPR